MNLPIKLGSDSHQASHIAPEILQVASKLMDQNEFAKIKVGFLRKNLKENQIPTSIFSNTNLSGLELVCKYMKEELGNTLPEIALILKRSYFTVYATYTKANKKQSGRLSVAQTQHFFPAKILSDRKLSVLESIVFYLKNEYSLRFCQIATELCRNERNIWTVYKRAAKKLPHKQISKATPNANLPERAVDKAIVILRKKFRLTRAQTIHALLQATSKEIAIPTSIFSETRLSGLELICRYLKEELKLTLPEIAKLINRDYNSTYKTYQKATFKQTDFFPAPGKYFFPATILCNRELSVLQSIVCYLKDSLGLRFTEIASELHRDQRNIWTVYKRAKKKTLENAKD
jgi:hypothetical protein